MTYAKNTKVNKDRSREEIECTLQRFGADQFAYGWDAAGQAMVSFRYANRQIRYHIVMPDKSQFAKTETGRKRKDSQIQIEWEQACKARWRSLSLLIKAKLVGIEDGIVSFESEFLPNTVLPDGTTVETFMLPQVERAYATGSMPPLLSYLKDE